MLAYHDTNVSHGLCHATLLCCRFIFSFFLAFFLLLFESIFSSGGKLVLSEQIFTKPAKMTFHYIYQTHIRYLGSYVLTWQLLGRYLGR